MTLSDVLVEAARAVHRELGPGLLEATYERCLAHELSVRRVRAERQAPRPLRYRGILMPAAYRIDVLVENQIIVEIKTVDRLRPIHATQVRSYLQLSGLPLALLINFNVHELQHGIRWFVRPARRRRGSLAQVLPAPAGSVPDPAARWRRTPPA